MRNVDVLPATATSPSATTDPRLFGAFVEHLGRCVYGGIFEPGHPTADEQGLPRRRARAGARAGADDHALSRRQLRLRLQLGGRRRPGRRSARAGSTSPGCRPRPTSSAPTSSSTGAAPPASSRCWRSISARAAATRPATWSNTATIPAARRSPTCAARTAGSKPHDVKFWCLGNEMDGPWQMEAKTADEYGRIAVEAAKMMRWIDPSHRARRLRLVGPQHADLRRLGRHGARAHLRPCRVHLAAHLSQQLRRRHARPSWPAPT